MNRWWACCGAGLLMCVTAVGGVAQFVSGDWVSRSEASVREHRTASVSFLVLDSEGKLAPNATIHIEQVRHAFALGFAVHGEFPASYDAEAEGWRAFNAVSLEPLTTWRQMQPDGPGSFARDEVDAAIASAEAAVLNVRWGSLASADPFDLPEWVVPLRGEALFAALRAYSDRVATVYGRDLTNLDLAEETLGHARLTPAMLRLLAHDWQAVRNDLPARLRYEQALMGSRTFAVVTDMDAVIKQRLGVAGFTLDHEFLPRPVAQDLLEPALQRLTRFGRPITFGSLEIGGAHAIETAVNTETVVRTLFADPMVDGVYFSGLTADEISDPSAAVFDEAGQPTAVGRTLDRLFRETWWTDIKVTTDALGKAEAEVFRGEHVVTATLSGGGTVKITLVLDDPKAEPDQIILMPVVVDTE